MLLNRLGYPSHIFDERSSIVRKQQYTTGKISEFSAFQNLRQPPATRSACAQHLFGSFFPIFVVAYAVLQGMSGD